jgi:hypothetical protein
VEVAPCHADAGGAHVDAETHSRSHASPLRSR